MPTSNSIVAQVSRSATGRVRKTEKPLQLVLEMRAGSRPTILTLADAPSKIDKRGLEPIEPLRGGATAFSCYRGDWGALTWIEGETKTERFRIAIPTSRWFSGKDQNNKHVELPITSFNGTTIRRDGLLRLAKNRWIDCVKFDITPLRFKLTPVEMKIASLVSEYLNSKGETLPTEYVDFARLGAVNWTYRMPSLVDFVRQNWHRDEWQTTRPPSRETIAGTLDALFIRRRSRAN